MTIQVKITRTPEKHIFFLGWKMNGARTHRPPNPQQLPTEQRVIVCKLPYPTRRPNQAVQAAGKYQAEGMQSSQGDPLDNC